MPSPLIGASEYPQIRSLVGASEAELPDAVLELPIYVPAAIDEVKRYVPDAEERTDPDEVTHLQNAAVYLSAARVGPFVATPTQERWDDYAVTNPAVDWAARAAWLRGLAADDIRLVDPGAVPSGAGPPIFTVAPAGRRVLVGP